MGQPHTATVEQTARQSGDREPVAQKKARWKVKVQTVGTDPFPFIKVTGHIESGDGKAEANGNTQAYEPSSLSDISSSFAPVPGARFRSGSKAEMPCF